ncbi:TPA: peptidyl-prolyl cis-trans isomerase, partial [Neisseria meningitidis]
MNAVSKIARVKTATRGFYQNVPVQPVKIRRVVVGQ